MSGLLYSQIYRVHTNTKVSFLKYNFQVLCNHSFHSQCLKNWADHTCPVCRYSQVPADEHSQDNNCQTCNSQEDLWICIVCGNVGCGRYTKEHAQQHYLETTHNFAMALR